MKGKEKILKFKAKSGITLIALVITIIVLLILSGISIIMVTGNNGILTQTQNAKKENSNAQIKEKIELAIVGSRIKEGNYGKIDKKTLEDELKKIGNVEYNTEMDLWKVETSDGYKFKIFSTGEIKDISGKIEYTQNGTSVTKGEDTYNVGDDYTDYTCDSNVYNGGWKILGAENGELLIMSAKDICELELSGIDGYNNGLTTLKNICTEKFGLSARSIEVEDINRITGYNPNSDGDGKIFGAGYDYEYGVERTYTINGTESGLESTYYKYNPTTLKYAVGSDVNGLATTSDAFVMLFGEEGNYSKYWLASQYNKCFIKYYIKGMRVVGYDGDGMYIHGEHLIMNSTGPEENYKSYTYGVRAVISISD